MNSGLELQRWSFWSPETQSPAQWCAHWRQPNAVPGSAGAGSAIPPMHRRRMSQLSKQALEVALQAGADANPEFLVFCSQHGELPRTRGMLADIVAGRELSPFAFSQSVHNTSAGLYTIITRSTAPATAVASGASTFAYGWIEAHGFLRENPSARVLLVMADDSPPSEYLPFIEPRPHPYAFAALLARATHRGARLEPTERASGPEEPLPLAPLFAAWWLEGSSELRVTAGGQGWIWSRDGA
jgi:hypothetical protein